MSDFVDYDLGFQPGQTVVEVELDAQANVQLVDGPNFNNYRNGRRFMYVGGHATRSPFRLLVPHGGHWHVVIDLGGASGTVRSQVRVLGN